MALRTVLRNNCSKHRITCTLSDTFGLDMRSNPKPITRGQTSRYTPVARAGAQLRRLGVFAALLGIAWLPALLTSCSSDESTSASMAAESDDPFSGTFLGTLELPGLTLRVALNFERAEGGGYRGTLDSPDQEVYGIKAHAVEVRERTVTVQFRAIMASFSGELSEDGQTLTGSFTQGGTSVPLSLEKQPGPLSHARPQDPVAPYPYDAVEVTVNNAEAGVELACTLSIPKGVEPRDSVVLITGSGSQNRDEEGANHRPFLVLSDALARENIAVLRCDDRGFGDSTGDAADATSLDFASDVRAAVTFMREQSQVEIARVGLIGHSEGGLIAPLAADMNPDVDFLVLLAAPGVRGDEVLLSQLHAIAVADGADASALAHVDAINRAAVDIARDGDDPESIERELRTLLKDEGLSEPELESAIAALVIPWMRFFLNHDPAPVLRRISQPVLALNGSRDVQVLPDLNLPAIEAALQAGGNTDVTTQVLDGLNHMFQHAKTGSPMEYLTIEETFATEAMATIAAWIHGARDL